MYKLKPLTMKSRSLLLFGIIALLTVFGYQSCDLTQTESPQLDVTQETPVFAIRGTVTSADDGTALSGISVLINESEVITDNEGNYEFKAENMPLSGSIVKVEADGYITAIGEVNYGETVPNFLFLDFALSRELPANFVNLTNGGEISFEDVTVTVPANNGAVLNGQTLESIELSVSPISPLSTMGNWVGATLKALKFEPAGVEFDIPVSFSIETPAGYVHNGLNIYEYDEATNTWVEMTNEVSYSNGTVSFELRSFPGGVKLANPGSITIDDDFLGVDAFVRFNEENCACADLPGTYSYGFYTRQLSMMDNPDYSAPAYADGIMSELNSLHFFANNGLPYNPYIVAGILVSPAANVTVGSCDAINLDVYPLYRTIKGWYEYQGENKEFLIKYIYGATYTVEHVDCGTSTECHQGCPL